MCSIDQRLIMASTKRAELSNEKKMQLIRRSTGRSYHKLAADFDIGRTQVANILKRKAEYLSSYEDNYRNARLAKRKQSSIVDFFKK